MLVSHTFPMRLWNSHRWCRCTSWSGCSFPVSRSQRIKRYRSVSWTMWCRWRNWSRGPDQHGEWTCRMSPIGFSAVDPVESWPGEVWRNIMSHQKSHPYETVPSYGPRGFHGSGLKRWPTSSRPEHHWWSICWRGSLLCMSPAPSLTPEVFEELHEKRKQTWSSNDMEEGVQAFFAKRPPSFRGN